MARDGVLTSVDTMKNLKTALFAGTGVCLVTAFAMMVYASINSHVAPDGRVVEPFFLIPLGYLVALVGVLLGVVGVAAGRWERRQATTG